MSARNQMLTDTLTVSTDIVPLGSAVNRRDERAIAARSPMMQEDRKAETLLTREKMLCIWRVWCNYFSRIIVTVTEVLKSSGIYTSSSE